MSEAIRFRAMAGGSQGSSGDPVLYFRADIDPTDLFETAASRLDSALNLVDALASLPRGTMADITAVADGLTYLLSDANGMFQAVHGLLLELNERREAMAPVTLLGDKGGEA